MEKCFFKSDNPGKKMIQNIFKVPQNPRFRGRIAFVEDYGEEVAKYLIKGVDVWLNNPKIPLEACGTSGMKAAVNGTLHFSAMDGWWIEGYNRKNGWSIGGDSSNDEADAKSIYDTLRDEIIPLYYQINDEGISPLWIKKMKESIMSIAPRFSARRMMNEYLEKFYLPIEKMVKGEG